jgi:hypothetical protein
MWKPAKPIVIAGVVLTDQEAWWLEFSREFHELCEGMVDHEWLAGFAATLYPLNRDRPPRESALVAFATLSYEHPEMEAEPSEGPAPDPKPGLH